MRRRRVVAVQDLTPNPLAPHAVKRLIEPEEVARVVEFLVGPEGAAFTGTAVTMDLGWTAR